MLLTTSFTKIIVVLSLTRNALGLQGVPPNQVLVGLSLFLSLFIMGPVISQVNNDALQPYLNGDATFAGLVFCPTKKYCENVASMLGNAFKMLEKEMRNLNEDENDMQKVSGIGKKTASKITPFLKFPLISQ